MDGTIPFQNALGYLALGITLGLVGQGIRVAVGVKKIGDEARAKHTSFAQEFDWTELLVSLLIGAVAGGLATVTLWGNLANVNQQTVIALISAGYAGTDFIEGIVRNSGDSISIGESSPESAAKLKPSTIDLQAKSLPDIGSL
jgi:hypothetical protein